MKIQCSKALAPWGRGTHQCIRPQNTPHKLVPLHYIPERTGKQQQIDSVGLLNEKS